jgi:hypothetical protein
MTRLTGLFLCILFFVSFRLSAQNKDGAVTLPDTMQYPYIHIAGMEITGNKLTKDRIITRELDFKVGDSLATFESGKGIRFTEKRFAPGDSSQLRLLMTYSRENLINTKLFLTVNLSLRQESGNRYTVLIDVTERHYWWLFPVVKLNAPNFNEWLRDPNWSDLSIQPQQPLRPQPPDLARGLPGEIVRCCVGIPHPVDREGTKDRADLWRRLPELIYC